MPYTRGVEGGGHRPVGGRAEIWPPLLPKPSPRASQRERCCSHFTSAHQGFCPPGRATPSFQKGTIRAGGILRLAQWGLGLLRGQQPSRSHSRQSPPPPPPSRPAHLVERHPTPSLRATRLPLPSSSVSSGWTPVFTEATFPLQVQNTCSSAIWSRMWPTPPKMCSG